MCGLVGVFRGGHSVKSVNGAPFAAYKAMLNHLLFLDSLRGMDSTGVCVVNKTGEVAILKDTTAGWNFIAGSGWKDIQHSVDMKPVVIGHNRAATTGGKSYEAAHPHRSGPVVLAHNGTLRGSWRTSLPPAVPNDVDSARIAAGIRKNGVQKTLESIDGAYALTWVDMEENTFNMIHNKERPLAVAWHAKTESLWWASERDMLKYAAERADLDIDWHTEFPIDRLLSIGLNDKLSPPKEVKEVDEWIKSLTVPMEGNKFAPLVKTYTGGTYHHGTTTSGGGGSTATTAYKPKVPSSKDQATFLNKYKLKTGDTVRVKVRAFSEYIGVGKNSQPVPSGKGLLLADLMYLGEQVPVIVLDFSKKRYEKNNTILQAVSGRVHSAMWFKQPESNEQRWVIVLENNNLSHTQYANRWADMATDDHVGMETNGPKTHVGFGGEMITESQWSDYTQHGCGLCWTPLDQTSPDKIHWPWKTVPVCHQCHEEHKFLLWDVGTNSVMGSNGESNAA